ncbi:MAG: hypothetical protein ACPHCN_17535, partial [Mycobacterium sp.]
MGVQGPGCAGGLVACGRLRRRTRGGHLISTGRQRTRYRKFLVVLAVCALAFSIATLILRALPLG